MHDVTVRMKVNGTDRAVDLPARTSLADALRDQLGLTGTRLGCEQGVCGACTVLVDDLPARACLVLAASCEGSEVVTVEGLEGPDADRLRSAFSREGGLQCGFCTAGMLVTGMDLVRRREELSREALCEALAGNICRCTGYNGIVCAIQDAISEGIAAETADGGLDGTARPYPPPSTATQE
ncbi:MAG: (2Fe-2S)-binding protein [Actinomycetota bacterium]|nr:(2Fe-2S)-binding protein [Actinomycetota bacterium]